MLLETTWLFVILMQVSCASDELHVKNERGGYVPPSPQGQKSPPQTNHLRSLILLDSFLLVQFFLQLLIVLADGGIKRR